jgi:hypothetical protein
MQSSSSLSATLLIMKKPRSPRLTKAFGVQRLTALRESILQSIIPTLDAALLDKQQALISKWAGWIGLVSENKRENSTTRKETLGQLQSDWKEALDLDLAAMHTYFVMCVQGLSASQPLDFQEADGIASFIRNLFAALLQEVNLVRFSW